MKIGVVAANGGVGQDVTQEAVNRGHDVTAIVRGDNKSAAQSVVQKDLFDLTAQDIQDFDVLVDAFGIFDPNKLDQHQTSLQHLSDITANNDNIRLLVVGGAGSLYMDDSHTTQLLETPDFPAEFRPLAESMSKALTQLRTRKDVRWTYISPAADFDKELPRTGQYILAGEEFTLNPEGKSVISYPDYAVAMVDEIEKGKDGHIQERISVVQK